MPMKKEDYDLNGNGKIDPDEREIMLEDRRRRMEDQDAKRDTQRRLTVACTAGMLVYPLVIFLAVWVGLDRAAELITDIASVYVIGASGVVAAYFGFNAMEANDLSVDEIVSRIKQTIGDKPVYLTFDIDCLDPAFAPGTGTPVCGGLNSDKILKIIRGLQGVNMVGMDVVEVSPAYDQSDITALAGATIALELLYVWTANRLAD